MPVSLEAEEHFINTRQSLGQGRGANNENFEEATSQENADRDEPDNAFSNARPVSREALLKELYQIASRRSHDPHEGLTIQLQDGLRTMVEYWDMTIGMVAEVSGIQISVTNSYFRTDSIPVQTGTGNSVHEAEHTTRQQFDMGRKAQLEQMEVDLERAIDVVSPITHPYSANLLNTSALTARVQIAAPSSLMSSSNPWDQLLAQTRSYLSIPLSAHDHHYGTLCFLGTKQNRKPWTRNDKELLALFGSWVGSVLERTQSRSLRASEQSDLARINKEIAQSNSDLDHFVYIASHDLKEPLRGISQYAQFLTEDYYEQLDEEGRRMLTALIEQSQRMVKQIDDLRFYSRIGRHDSGIDLVDLNEIVADVRARLHALLDDTKAGIRIPRTLPSIQGNMALITTVFQNLIANAARYNDKQLKWIQISWYYQEQNGDGTTRQVHPIEPQPDEDDIELAEADDAQTSSGSELTDVAAVIRNLQEGGGQIVITVADNGIGIRERDQEAVFTMFRRLHNQDEFGGGTGAGLAIVKRILEQQGGDIWFNSKFGTGTQFHFTFG